MQCTARMCSTRMLGLNAPAPQRRGLLRGRRSRVAVRASSAEPSSWSSPDEQQWPQQHVRQHAETSSLDSEPSETLRSFLERAKEGNAHALLEVLPDAVIDKAVEQSRESGSLDDLQLHDLICSCSSSDPSSSEDDLYLDTYALRNLLYAGPRTVQVLSGLHITTDKYLQRCAIVAPSGEECVLTFMLSLQDSLECQYRGPPLVTRKWMLSSVVGECSSDELPAHPSPSFPPEAVVEAQLHALREFKVASVFAHTSPERKAATGPVERFAAMLHHNPTYNPLLGHLSATSVQRLQPTANTYMEVVRVQPRPAAGVAQQSLLYMWIVSRQGDSSNWHNCWMTDGLQLLEMPPAQQRGSGPGK